METLQISNKKKRNVSENENSVQRTIFIRSLVVFELHLVKFRKYNRWNTHKKTETPNEKHLLKTAFLRTKKKKQKRNQQNIQYKFSDLVKTEDFLLWRLSPLFSTWFWKCRSNLLATFLFGWKKKKTKSWQWTNHFRYQLHVLFISCFVFSFVLFLFFTKCILMLS